MTECFICSHPVLVKDTFLFIAQNRICSIKCFSSISVETLKQLLSINQWHTPTFYRKDVLHNQRWCGLCVWSLQDDLPQPQLYLSCPCCVFKPKSVHDLLQHTPRARHPGRVRGEHLVLCHRLPSCSARWAGGTLVTLGVFMGRPPTPVSVFHREINFLLFVHLEWPYC